MSEAEKSLLRETLLRNARTLARAAGIALTQRTETSPWPRNRRALVVADGRPRRRSLTQRTEISPWPRNRRALVVADG